MIRPTPEEARNELIRRGIIKPEANNFPSITAEEAKKELMRRKIKKDSGNFSGNINFNEKITQLANDKLPKPSTPTSATSIPRDIGEIALNVFPEAQQMAYQLPSDIVHGISEPGGITRIGENLDYGALRTLRGLGNLPSKGAKYIQSKTGVRNPVSEWSIPKTKYEERMESDAREGDALARMIGGGAPLAPVAAFSPALAGLLFAEANDANPILGTLISYAGPKVAAKGKEFLKSRKEIKELPKAEVEAQQAVRDYEAANQVSNELFDRYGYKTPQAVKTKIGEKSRKKSTLQEKLAELQAFNENIQNSQPISPQGQSGTQKLLPPPTGEVALEKAMSARNTQKQRVEESERSLKEHEAHVGQSREIEIAKAEEAANQHFGKSKAHRQRLGSYLAEKQAAVEEAISSEYNSHERNLEKYDIEIPNKPELKEARQTIKENEHYLDEKSAEEAAQIQSNDINFNVNAKDINSTLKTLKAIKYNLMGDLKGLPDIEIKARRKEANKVQKQINALEELLKNNIPEELYTGLKATNKRFSTEVIPARKHTGWKNVKKDKVFPSRNVVESLATEEAGDVLMRNYILESPEMTALAIGERFAGNPKAWLEESELLTPYFEKSPQSGALIENYRQSQRPMESYLEENISTKELKNRRVEALKAYADAEGLLQKAQEEADFLGRQWKEVEKSIIESQKPEAPAKKPKLADTKKIETTIDNLKKELEHFNRILPELEKAANEKNISWEEKIKREQKVKDLKEKKDKTKNTMVGMLGNGVGFGVITKILSSLF